ncbi:MAG TPA: sensor histidine kinase [Clostridia bacterium]|nr:sensor histidine kinase [Clostridia bacterium]
MNRKLKLLYYVFRDIAILVTFVLAVYLEHAGTERFFRMLVLFALFFIWIHFRDFYATKIAHFLPLTFITDIVILMLLDNSSKFVVNYYFNIYYFFILISAGLMLQQRYRIIVSIAIVVAAFVKYYTLIEVALSSEKYYNMPFVVSYIFFTFMIFITIAIFFNYSRALSEEKSKLDEMNRKLTDVNRLLEQKNEIIKELTIFEERNRIARDIHDSVGHNLTGLIMNLDFCEKLAEKDPAKVKEQISVNRNIAKECLAEIRKSIQALKPVSLEQLPLIKSIEEIVAASKQKFKIDIKLKVKGEIYKTPPEFNIVVYRAVQEAVTNSVRHGKATTVEIEVAYGRSELSLFIKDNGKGAEKFQPGNGLKGMLERVRELNGDAGFFSRDGFMINLRIPTNVAERN